ncbi:MAG: sugar ABC transporter permease, partial [Rhodobacteraceae bacterium]|nr:sugar ABC transporter permease [Paracoccaceae bacterium]
MTESISYPPPLPVRTEKRGALARRVCALMLREMATSQGRAPGGYLWAVLEPVAGITLMSLIFSLALRNPSLGVTFPLFYATGMLPFTLFTHLTGRIAQ